MGTGSPSECELHEGGDWAGQPHPHRQQLCSEHLLEELSASMSRYYSPKRFSEVGLGGGESRRDTEMMVSNFFFPLQLVGTGKFPSPGMEGGGLSSSHHHTGRKASLQ